ncbi:MAG: HAMP domain-containing histidine kinase [Acidobacteria bacterium]|nr:HAMP domain-containing histidine kinase [Acidobacteriota bacterium]
MNHRRQSLQQRVARYVLSVVVASLLVSGVAFVLSKRRSLTRSMEASARTFGALVALPMAHMVERYGIGGRRMMERTVIHYARLNPDLVRLQVANVSGRVLLDARIANGHVALEVFREGEPGEIVPRGPLRTALEGLRVVGYGVEEVPHQGRLYRVISPAVETWGKHSSTLIASFSYRRVDRELLKTICVTGLLLLVSLIFSWGVSLLLARTITQNVEELHAGVRRISAGRFDERVSVKTGDEIQDLADSFNSMADRLQSTIEALRDAYIRLESLDRAKRTLLATVSHELKTPLTALRGYLELLEDGRLGDLSPKAARAVTICQNNVARLTRRIEELMELARLDRDGAMIPLETVDLSHVVQGVLEAVWPRVEDKDLRCSIKSAARLQPIQGNVEQLERLFTNLMDNAIKFTPAGGAINITLENHSLHDVEGVLVRITDSGVGIPEEHLGNVFGRFYQVDQTSRRKFGGMGLGLALVKRAVELHHGEVWVESTVNVGSTFFVWLPREGGEHSGALPDLGTLGNLLPDEGDREDS